MRLLHAVAPLLAAFPLACSTGESVVEGPEEDIFALGGSCDRPGSGARACYHAPGPSDTWLPDCRHLARDYWRVFRQQSGTAYLIPRPDGTGLSFGICGGPDMELEALFDRLGLCSESLPAGGVAAINAIDPADAQRVATALHERLEFRAVLHSSDRGRENWDVQPFLPWSDIVAACDAYGSGAPALDAGLCEDLRAQFRQGSCTSEYLLHDRATAETLADWANRLYEVL